jgi:lipopolysaccharide export system permease protein
LSLTLVILLTQSIKYLELVISSDASVIYFLYMITLAIPKFLEAILPLAFTIGCIYTVRRLMNDREVVIMNASGASFMDIGRAFIIFAGFMMAVQFLLSGWGAPLAVAQLQKTQGEVKSHYATLIFREGVFTTLGNGLTAYVEKREGLNEIKNLVIHDEDGVISKGKATTIIAKRGIINLTNDSQQLLVYDGTQYIKDKKNGQMSQLDFEQYTLNIPIENTIMNTRWQKPDERTLDKLFINNATASDIDIRKNNEFTAEIHKRFSTPFLYMGFILCIMTFLFLGEWDRRSQTIPLLKAVAVIVGVQVAHIVVYNQARDVALANIGLYIVAILPILYGSYRLYNFHR